MGETTLIAAAIFVVNKLFIEENPAGKKKIKLSTMPSTQVYSLTALIRSLLQTKYLTLHETLTELHVVF